MAAQAVQNVEGAISAAPHGPAGRRGTFVSMQPDIQISRGPYGLRSLPRSLFDLRAADGWAADPSKPIDSRRSQCLEHGESEKRI